MSLLEGDCHTIIGDIVYPTVRATADSSGNEVGAMHDNPYLHVAHAGRSISRRPKSRLWTGQRFSSIIFHLTLLRF